MVCCFLPPYVDSRHHLLFECEHSFDIWVLTLMKIFPLLSETTMIGVLSRVCMIAVVVPCYCVWKPLVFPPRFSSNHVVAFATHIGFGCPHVRRNALGSGGVQIDPGVPATAVVHAHPFSQINHLTTYLPHINAEPTRELMEQPDKQSGWRSLC